MQMQSILEWSRRKPFQPFRIIMTDGEVIDVRNPEFIMPTYSVAVVGVKFDKDGLPQHSRFVSYLYVDKIEPLESAIQPGVNTA